MKADATRALDNSKQIPCPSVYLHTYGVILPTTSVQILDCIVPPLTNGVSCPSRVSRRVHTVASFDYDEMSVRMCFVQPEISCATATCPSSLGDSMFRAREIVMRSLSNPSPGGLQISGSKCQVKGRISPYVVECSGLSPHVTWTYCNAAKARFFYIVTTATECTVMYMSRETVSLYESYSPDDCAMVYAPGTRCNKITVSPPDSDMSSDPGKSTCMFLYTDGSFKVTGVPQRAHRVCEAFRETVVKAHCSPMHRQIMKSLVRQ